MLWSPDHRRKHLLAQPYPAEWDAFFVRNLAHYGLLDEEERVRLRDNTRIFVAEKYWEGCGGLEVTEEMRVTIAAQACLMLLGMAHDYFSRVLSILIYPSSFLVPNAGEHDEEEKGWALVGQTFRRGPVILAWDAVLAEGQDPSMGRNLVIHEFAHQLDLLDGYLEGTLDLAGEQAERWQTVLAAEYNQLRRDVRNGLDTFLGEYAATDKTEFFAVASECFFTLPLQLRRHHPALYAVLVEGYGLDPSRWFGSKEPAA